MLIQLVDWFDNELFKFSSGSFNGTLLNVPASDLGAVVVKEVLKRSNTDAADVNEVILGQVKKFIKCHIAA